MFPSALRTNNPTAYAVFDSRHPFSKQYVMTSIHMWQPCVHPGFMHYAGKYMALRTGCHCTYCLNFYASLQLPLPIFSGLYEILASWSSGPPRREFTSSAQNALSKIFILVFKAEKLKLARPETFFCQKSANLPIRRKRKPPIISTGASLSGFLFHCAVQKTDEHGRRPQNIIRYIICRPPYRRRDLPPW